MKRIQLIIGIIPAFFLTAGTAYCGDLKSPYSLESSATLPEGVRNPQVKGILTWVEGKYTSGGDVQPLGDPLSRSVSWGQVIATKSPVDQAKLRYLLQNNGVSESDLAGSINTEINSFASIIAPVFAYGVTPWWTTALAVPVYKIEIKSKTGFQKSQKGEKIVNLICNSGQDACNSAKAGFNDLKNKINTTIESMGYDPIDEEQELSAIGDVKLVNKIRLVHSKRNHFSVTNEITLPTGRVASPNKLVQPTTGDGQLDVGLIGSYDYDLQRDWVFNAHAGYTHQFADSLIKRIPSTSDSPLSSDTEWVRRDLGDQLKAGSAIAYTFRPLGLTLGAQYDYQYQLGTTYSGSQFHDSRYRMLESFEPAQSLHSATVQLKFSTIDWYRKKQFAVPLSAALSYGHPIYGKNVTDNDLYAADLIMFF